MIRRPTHPRDRCRSRTSDNVLPAVAVAGSSGSASSEFGRLAHRELTARSLGSRLGPATGWGCSPARRARTHPGGGGRSFADRCGQPGPHARVVAVLVEVIALTATVPDRSCQSGAQLAVESLGGLGFDLDPPGACALELLEGRDHVTHPGLDHVDDRAATHPGVRPEEWNKFGKPGTVSPRYARGNSAHSSARVRPPTPAISTGGT